MGIYLLNYIAVGLWYGLIRNKKVFITIICLQMWIIMMLRSVYLGTDMLNYSLYYQMYSSLSFWDMISDTRLIGYHYISHGVESGYVWLNWALIRVGFDFHSYILIHTTLLIIGLRRFLLKNESRSFYIIFLIIGFGVWGCFFSILRQSLALVILLQSVDSIKERNFVKFICTVFFATLFHKTAVLFLPIYWLYSIRITTKNVIVALAVGGGEFLVIPYLNTWGDIIFSALGKGDLYKIGDFHYNNMFMLLVVMFVTVMALSKWNKIVFDDSCRVSVWCFVLAIYIQIVAFWEPTFSRASIPLLFPFSTVVIGEIIVKQRDVRVRMILGSACYLLTFIFYVFFVLNRSSICPYVPFWYD